MTKQRLQKLLSRIATADEKAPTKGDLEVALGGLAREFDVEALASISEDDYQRDGMIEEAEKAARSAYEEADKELSDDARRVALKEKLQEHSGATLLPVGQVHLRIYHPKLKDEFFLINAFGTTSRPEQPELIGTAVGEEDPDAIDAFDTPSEDVSYGRGTLLSEAPDWALPGIHEEIESGDAELHTSRAAMREANRERREEQRTRPILQSRRVSMQVRPERVGEGRDTRIVRGATGDFKKPEQETAWAVLNEEVAGEAPLPDEYNPDPREAGPVEVRHVGRRVESALERPERFGFNGDGFDRETFFNQLLELELTGFTPARQHTPDNNSPIGGMRPTVYKRILEIAEDQGFEVMGDHVRIAPQKDLSRPSPFDEATTRRTLQPVTPWDDEAAFAGSPA